MSTTTIAIRTDEETKREAQKLFKSMGMDMSTAINMFLRQTISEHRLPFRPGLSRFEREVLDAASEPAQKVESLEEFIKEIRDA
ncbi:MAG: type II toxin-antitoxin system RelB/DinJ family antitoxin [Bifidobacterium sp.]|uniref:Type II toxin-antitoxin system RelB/DinJ family antitoxin n=1 Tax=Bifidobacterium fermentum TaxID=3059035 RepID=A0AB39UP49_9BIFI